MQNTIIGLGLLTILIVGCGETELEKNTRSEYSAVIRRIDANYQSLLDNKQQEESLSMVKTRDFYSSYIETFSKIRDDLAGAPNAEKFDSIRTKLSSILTTSNRFFNNRQSTLLSAFRATNSYSNYGEDLSDLVSYVQDYDRYSSESILNRRISIVIQDSIEFYDAYREFGKNIQIRDSLITVLTVKASSLNQGAKSLNFKDTLSFHSKVIGKENILTNAWNNLKGVSISPTGDIGNLYGSSNTRTVKESTGFSFSIKGVTCENNFSESSSRSDFDWAGNYDWKKNEYVLSCPASNAQRGTVKISYQDEVSEFPIEKGTATFDRGKIGKFMFTLLGKRIGVIVRLKKLFGEPNRRDKFEDHEELAWEIGSTSLFLNSRDNNSRLLVQK